MSSTNKDIAEFNRFLESKTGLTLGKILDLYLNGNIEEIQHLVSQMKAAREPKLDMCGVEVKP